jgi:hypothetical protein
MARGHGKHERKIAMSPMYTSDFTLRYQQTPCARYHVRPLSLLQQDVMYRCNGRVTVADLADATMYSRPEIRAVLSFLIAHGLVKTLPPEPWLLDLASSKKPARPAEPPQSRIKRVWLALTRPS